jgi:hypothetical protein
MKMGCIVISVYIKTSLGSQNNKKPRKIIAWFKAGHCKPSPYNMFQAE